MDTPTERVGMDKILAQLSSLKEHCLSFVDDCDDTNIWKDDVAALETATAILSALADEGVTDPESLKDLLYDYRLQAKQNQELRRKFETPASPILKNDVLLCPECRHRIHPRHSFCHWCGKMLREKGRE